MSDDRPDLDAPTPPGGPLRQDAPGATLPGTEQPAPDPDVVPSGTPDGPATIPTPEDPVPDPDPHRNPGGPDDAERSEQQQNAGTQDGEPSS